MSANKRKIKSTVPGVSVDWYGNANNEENHIYIIFVGIDLIRTACGLVYHRSEITAVTTKPYCISCDVISKKMSYD